jgi:transposase-like protein
MSSQSVDKRSLWKSRIDQYRASGLSAKEWCAKNDTNFNTLKYWISRLNKESTVKRNSAATTFVAVPAEPLLKSKSSILIRLGKISIEVSDGCAPDLLSNLLGILKNYA